MKNYTVFNNIDTVNEILPVDAVNELLLALFIFYD